MNKPLLIVSTVAVLCWLPVVFSITNCNSKPDVLTTDPQSPKNDTTEMEECLIHNCLMPLQTCHETPGCEKEASCIGDCATLPNNHQNECMRACEDYTTPDADKAAFEFFKCGLIKCSGHKQTVSKPIDRLMSI
jgi:hypothetical protein